MAMLLCPLPCLRWGIIVANAKPFQEWRLNPFIVIRQLIVPALLFLRLNALGRSSVGGCVRGGVRYAGGLHGSVFAQMMGRDPQLPTCGTVLSTLASFIAVPLLFAWMTMTG